jgi:pyruvate,water dikinase
VTARWIDDNLFNPDLPVWTRGFAAELVPGPITPLGWDLIWEGTATSGWRDAFVDRLGFPEAELDPDRPELIGVLGGHVYINASTLRLLAARTPGLAPDHFDAAFGLDGLGLPPFEPAGWHHDQAQTEGPLTEWMSWVLAGGAQTELEAGRVLALEAVDQRPSLTALSDTELVERAVSLRPLCRALVAQHVNQTVAATIGPGILAAVCAGSALPITATELISGVGEIELASPVHGMWTLSRLVRSSPLLLDAFDSGLDGIRGRLVASEEVDAVGFLAGFDALLREVGHRGVNEWDLHGPTWEQAPELAFAAIDRLRLLPDGADPGARLTSLEVERAELVDKLGAAVASEPVTRDHFSAAVVAATTFLRGRARSQSNVTRVINEMRVMVRELGERATGRGDVAHPDDLSMLFVDELAYYADGGLSTVSQVVIERRAHYAALLAQTPPDVIHRGAENAVARPVSPGTPSEEPAAPLDEGEVLLGRPAAAGVERGRARVLTEPSAIGSLTEDEVLVTDLPPPIWLPHLIGAVGVVADGGAALSHTMVVARDLGIPAVVGTRSATVRIPDGAVVEIDGLGGMVKVLETPPDAGLLDRIDGVDSIEGISDDPASGG